jgi:hypothetical protein
MNIKVNSITQSLSALDSSSCKTKEIHPVEIRIKMKQHRIIASHGVKIGL